jgi:hypothetical protein
MTGIIFHIFDVIVLTGMSSTATRPGRAIFMFTLIRDKAARRMVGMILKGIC